MAKKENENETINAQSEKMKALQAAMSKIEKEYGKGSIMRMGDEQIENVDVIPTGSLNLDLALGVGGYPRGRIIEIYGPESSGKTTLAIHAIAEAQKAGGIAAFIDAEHAFDRFYAQKLGVDIDNLWISQPDNGEQALEIADQLIRSSAIDILVVDSVAALTPKKEIEGDMGDSAVGLHARLMSQALRLSGTGTRAGMHPFQLPAEEIPDPVRLGIVVVDSLLPLFQVVLVVALVDVDGSVVHLHHRVGHTVEEIPVMGHHQQGATGMGKIVLEELDRI